MISGQRKHRDIIDSAERFLTPSCKVLKKLYGPLDVVYTDELDAAEIASASNCKTHALPISCNDPVFLLICPDYLVT